jgi:Arc/MetJ-type ribon-helix-helix transcriptional regulator
MNLMKTVTVRSPEPLAADIEEESRGRKISGSAVVRERLELRPRKYRRRPASLNAIADLIGSVDGLPAYVPMSLADACLVRMRRDVCRSRYLTADSDFRADRRHRGQVVPGITPEGSGGFPSPRAVVYIWRSSIRQSHA